MSIFKKKATEINNSNTNYEIAPGMHQAMCVGLCYKENVETEYKGVKKLQNQLQMYFAIAGEPTKTIVSRPFNMVFGDQSKLSEVLGTWGVTFDTIGDLVGKRASLVIVKKDKYMNINSILGPQGEPAIDLKEVYLPKFWLVDNDGKETGWDVMSLPEVGVRPEKIEEAQ